MCSDERKCAVMYGCFAVMNYGAIKKDRSGDGVESCNKV